MMYKNALDDLGTARFDRRQLDEWVAAIERTQEMVRHLGEPLTRVMVPAPEFASVVENITTAAEALQRTWLQALPKPLELESLIPKGLQQQIDLANARIGQVLHGLDSQQKLAATELSRLSQLSVQGLADFEAIAKLASVAERFGAPSTAPAVVQRFVSQVVNAPDEPTRRLGIRAIIGALVEGVSGVKIDAATPRDILVSRVALVWCLLSVLSFVLGQYKDAALRTQVADLRAKLDEDRRLRLEQSLTIAGLVEAVRQLQEPLKSPGAAPSPMLRVVRHGSLRETPHGHARKVRSISPGERFALKMAVGRWFYVESVDAVRGLEHGWIYRRGVAIERSR